MRSGYSYSSSFKKATALLALGSTSLATPALAFTVTVGGIGNTSTSSTLSMSTSASTDTDRHPLANLIDSFHHSWIEQLSPETESNRLKSKRKSPQDDGISNNVKRPVYNGHFVPVLPSALQNPRLVIHSPSMAQELNLSEQDIRSEQFVQYFSGDVLGALDHLPHEQGKQKVQSWATPYALSIMGKGYTSNCPFGTGDGYGDGRAISVGEVIVAETSHEHAAARYELQLKGAGPTPFCRGADGRAVLRSSIREFLASEAMHFLGVETTRARACSEGSSLHGDRSNLFKGFFGRLYFTSRSVFQCRGSTSVGHTIALDTPGRPLIPGRLTPTPLKLSVSLDEAIEVPLVTEG